MATLSIATKCQPGIEALDRHRPITPDDTPATVYEHAMMTLAIWQYHNREIDAADALAAAISDAIAGFLFSSQRRRCRVGNA